MIRIHFGEKEANIFKLLSRAEKIKTETQV